MSVEKPVGQYSLRLRSGKNDLTTNLNTVSIFSSKENTLQIIHLNLSLNREQYRQFLSKYKDNIQLEIMSGTGMNSDDSPPNVDASFSYELSILEEFSNQTQNTTSDYDTSSTSLYTLLCVSKNQYKQHQKFLKNKIFIDQTRGNILRDITSGSNAVIQSKIFKEGEVFEQVFIPPNRQWSAIKYLNFYINLFEGGEPLFINYCLDDKLYIGSCIKNNMTPLKIYYGTDPDTLDTSQLTSSKKSQYNYLIKDVMPDVNYYNTICAALGKKESYCFYPMNNLYSRLEMDINEFKKDLILANIKGENRDTINHIKKTNTKETWYRKHNGVSNLNSKDENVIFPENFITNYTNQCNQLKIKIEGAIKFSDFINIGKKVILTSNSNSMDYDGEYYLDSSVLQFKYGGSYWIGEADILIKTSVDLSKL